MDIKLIALDLDGTLLDADHATVPLRNVTALRAAAERGVLITIASGRTWSLLSDIRQQLGVLHYAALANGASVVDAATGDCLYENGIPYARWAQLLPVLEGENLPYEVYCEGNNYIRRDKLDLVRACAATKEIVELFERNSILVDDIGQALQGKTVEKIHIFEVNPTRRKALEEAFLAGGPLAVTGSFRNNMELTGLGVNKATAMMALCDRLGIPAESVMAFGDAGNDLELLRWAGYSFAMGNAQPCAVEAARYRTLTNSEGGVGAAVEEYLLNPVKA